MRTLGFHVRDPSLVNTVLRTGIPIIGYIKIAFSLKLNGTSYLQLFCKQFVPLKNYQAKKGNGKNVRKLEQYVNVRLQHTCSALANTQ